MPLGHRRLAILDLSSAGDQPMLSDDGQIGIVFNGCIYNFQELRRELKASGENFACMRIPKSSCAGTGVGALMS